MRKPENRKLLFGASLTMVLATVVLIVMDSPLLLVSTFPGSGLPLGNLIIWIGLISFPLAIYSGSRQLYHPQTRGQKVFRTLIWLLIILNAAWGLVGRYYSGNWGFNFRNDHQSFVRYWYYIYLIVLGPLLFLFTFGVYRLVQIFKNSRTKNVTKDY